MRTPYRRTHPSLAAGLSSQNVLRARSSIIIASQANIVPLAAWARCRSPAAALVMSKWLLIYYNHSRPRLFNATSPARLAPIASGLPVQHQLATPRQRRTTCPSSPAALQSSQAPSGHRPGLGNQLHATRQPLYRSPALPGPRRSSHTAPDSWRRRRARLQAPDRSFAWMSAQPWSPRSSALGPSLCSASTFVFSRLDSASGSVLTPSRS